MANDYNASINLNTAAAEKGVRDLGQAVGELDKKLLALDKTIKSSQGNLDTVTKSMSELTRANAALIRSETDRAKATVLAAKADREQIVNNGKVMKTATDRAIAEAKVAKLRSSTRNADRAATGTEGRRQAESDVRVANAAALGQQRLASETVRTATALENHAGAATRSGMATERAANQTNRFSAQQERARNSSLALNDSLSNSRYLLYDVGQTYSVLSAALLAIPTATAAVAIAYEKDFAQVMRTNMDLEKSGGSFATLRQELKDLAREIPLTFEQFAQISTIGGQLGIAGRDMGAFTETVAKFGAASNVSIDEASTAFGRFRQSFKDGSDQDYFNKLGSAIAYVGVKSVASEKEIVAVSNQISAAGSQFGFATKDIVGLSGALASVRIRPEMARGAFQRIMLNLSAAADAGAESFQTFAKYTGLATNEAMALMKSDPSEFFHRYIGGIKEAIAQTGSVSAVMEDIGAKNVFDKQMILGLANGYDVYSDSLRNASKAYEEGTFLNESTAGVFETVDAKLQRISNTMKNLGDTLGKGALAGLSGLADNLLNIVGAADRFVQANKGIAGFISLMMGFGAAVGGLLAFKAAQAFVLAGLVGFQQVLGKTSIAAGLTLKGNMQELAKTMLMAKGVTAEASAEFLRNAGTMKAMGASAVLTSTQIRAMNAGIGTAGVTASTSTPKVTGFAAGLRGTASAALGFVGGPVGALLGALVAIGLGFVNAEEKAKSAGDAIARAAANGQEAAKEAIGNELTSRTVDSFNPFESAAGLGDHGKNVRKIADEIGLSFADIVNSIAKGKDAGEEFGHTLDRLAQNKGYKNWAEMSANGFDDNAAKAKFLQHVVEQLGQKSAESGKDQEAVAKAAGKVGDAAAGAAPDAEALGDGLDKVGDKADDAKTKLEEMVDAMFGLVNGELATQEALGSLGESLQKSTSFNTTDAGGRDNISNLQDVLKNAALEQQQLIDSGEQTIQQASANYTSFIDSLVQEMIAKGVDPAQIQNLANRAKGLFGATMASGEQPKVKVEVDASKVDEAKAYLDSVVAKYGTTNLSMILSLGGTQQVADNVFATSEYVKAVTGEPYIANLDANSNPFVQKVTETVNWGFSVLALGPPFTAVIDANADPFTQVMQFVQQYAASVVNGIIDGFNAINQAGHDLTGGLLAANQVGHVGWGMPDMQQPAPKAAPAMPSLPALPSSQPIDNSGMQDSTKANQDNTSSLGGLKNAYDDAAAAAQDAGDKGKKAGEDAANGIDEATRAADDYANRLSQGLQAAYDKQNGYNAAVDAYQSKLNEIKKKRQDELDKIQELIAKQKELNNAKNEDLTGARKAGIEKGISQKYGETDRAADYAQQEQDLLDSAAAKQKDIDVSKQQQQTIQDGIGKMDGFSQAAIDNRNDLRDLESKMLDVISAYAGTGASQDQVKAKAEQLTGQFKKDVTQLGINRGAVDTLKSRMQLYRDTVRSVPATKPTKVTADTGAAKGAIDGIKSSLRAIPPNTNAKVTVTKETINTYKGAVIPMNQYLKDGSPVYRVVTPDGHGTNLRIYNKGGQVQGFAGGGQIPGKAPSNPGVDNLMAQVDGKGLVRVRSKEFIVQQPAVDYWGLDFMNAINNMKMPQFNGGGSVGGGSRGGSGSGGAMLVELTAEAIAAIQRMPPIILTTENRVIAEAANAGNAILATQGAN